MGVDCLVLGISQRGALTSLLVGRGKSTRTEFARYDSFGDLRLITYPVSHRPKNCRLVNVTVAHPWPR